MPEKTIREAILDTARGPASATFDGHSTTAQDIDQQIRADQHLAAQTAALQPHLGLQLVKLRSPGAG